MAIYHVAVEYSQPDVPSGVRYFYVQADTGDEARNKAVAELRREHPDAVAQRTELTASGWKRVAS